MQSLQASFGVSSIPSIRKLFCLDLSANSINFEDKSFVFKRSSSIPLMLVFKIFENKHFFP